MGLIIKMEIETATMPVVYNKSLINIQFIITLLTLFYTIINSSALSRITPH